uniref:ARAD1D19844p n=1 Tax=Blastobotrys adeninivorans TaxID=409370 RepID=A0A060TA20_BLAAD
MPEEDMKCIHVIVTKQSVNIAYHCALESVVKTLLTRDRLQEKFGSVEIKYIPVAVSTNNSGTMLDLANRGCVDESLSWVLVQIRQQTLKSLAKSWIKAIEPRKQARYPYKNGPRPPWWSLNIDHKEPDHISGDQRIPLLLSLLRIPRVTVDKLQQSLKENSNYRLAGDESKLVNQLFSIVRAERAYWSGSECRHVEYPWKKGARAQDKPKRRQGTKGDLGHTHPAKRPCLSRLSILSPSSKLSPSPSSSSSSLPPVPPSGSPPEFGALESSDSLEPLQSPKQPPSLAGDSSASSPYSSEPSSPIAVAEPPPKPLPRPVSPSPSPPPSPVWIELCREAARLVNEIDDEYQGRDHSLRIDVSEEEWLVGYTGCDPGEY